MSREKSEVPSDYWRQHHHYDSDDSYDYEPSKCKVQLPSFPVASAGNSAVCLLWLSSYPSALPPRPPRRSEAMPFQSWPNDKTKHDPTWDIQLPPEPTSISSETLGIRDAKNRGAWRKSQKGCNHWWSSQFWWFVIPKHFFGLLVTTPESRAPKSRLEYRFSRSRHSHLRVSAFKWVSPSPRVQAAQPIVKQASQMPTNFTKCSNHQQPIYPLVN